MARTGRYKQGVAQPLDGAEWDTYRKRLGAAFRDAREELDVPRHELAAKIGAAERTILEIERGECNGTMRTFFRVARGLGLSLHEVIP